MSGSDVVYEKHNAVAVVRLNRPEVLNAVRRSTFDELFAVLNDVAEDDSVRALMITGTGRAFCAGEDLREMAEALADPAAVAANGDQELERFQNLTRRIISLTKPTFAAVNGLAVGLGAELALACDIRIASDAASFGFTEAKRGLFQTNGVMFLLPRVIGYGRALEVLLTGDFIDAARARDIGLVSSVVSADSLLSEALDRAERIALNAPISIRLVKQVLLRSLEIGFDEVLELEVAGMKECLASADLVEGTAAFLEERAPVYRGE